MRRRRKRRRRKCRRVIRWPLPPYADGPPLFDIHSSSSKPGGQSKGGQHCSPHVGKCVRREEVDNIHGLWWDPTVLAFIDKDPRTSIIISVSSAPWRSPILHDPCLGYSVVLLAPP
jgi:hypothetical protein